MLQSGTTQWVIVVDERARERLEQISLQRRRLERHRRVLEQRLSQSGHHPQLRRELERLEKILEDLDRQKERILSEAKGVTDSLLAGGDGNEQRAPSGGNEEEENSGRRR
ncbi:MAG: hypothetical protein NZ959_04875 [Armatimonadetes bacterium]|nr:hypothetical protein [Armatimonadota bacterium]MDW8120907.1 hypothetical protein [Armatimonadota bacterium]